MPVAPLKELADEALAKGYAVPAINIMDELSLQAVVDAAIESRSPLIVQTSVKTVKSIGRDVLKAMFDAVVVPHPSKVRTCHTSGLLNDPVVWQDRSVKPA